MSKQPLIRILYLHNMTQISGGERSLLNLWENLDRQQFEPYLIIPQEGQLSRAAQALGISVFFLKSLGFTLRIFLSSCLQRCSLEIICVLITSISSILIPLGTIS